MVGRSGALWRQVFRETLSNWSAHDAFTQSAALAFYTLFSLSPLLILVIAVSGALFGAENVRSQVVGQLSDLMGREAAAAVQGLLEKASMSPKGGLPGIFGGAALLFGTTAVFIQLQTALNTVWEGKPKEGHVFRTLLKKRLLSFALVLAIGFLLLVSLALSAAVAAFGDYLRSRLPAPPALLEAANVVVSFVLFSFLFALIYRILPDADIPWRDVLVGSVATSALFSVGKWLIGLYIGHTSTASAYGAAGSVIVIVLWVYYTSLIVLFGAEFTRAHSKHFHESKRSASESTRHGRPAGG